MTLNIIFIEDFWFDTVKTKKSRKGNGNISFFYRPPYRSHVTNYHNTFMLKLNFRI